MIKTLIVYEDGKPELERCARLIAGGLPSATHEVRMRTASAVSIPDILASKLYFFGAEAEHSPSYAEVARVFSGINLAGRSAAYFGPSSSALKSLKEMAADTDLKAVASDLVESRPEPETVASWLRGFI